MPPLTNYQGTSKPSSMKISIITAAVFAAVTAGVYFYIPAQELLVEEQLPAVQKPAAAAPTESQSTPASVDDKPQIADKTPPEAPVADELPPLNNSDSLALTSAQQLSPLPEYAPILGDQDIIRNFVVFIDNFSSGELLSNFSPLAKPGEHFSVVKRDNEIYLDEQSYHRYDIYVDIINSMDIDYAITQYQRLKPLFDEAYQEIGYPENAFDSTLYDAIDKVLNAPVIREPIKLIAPSAMYKFADPELEALSSADKLMIRMGPNNILKLRSKLQQIQIALDTLQNEQL
ncbi:DUF3014 domain-containing protein [Psychromonas ossibalaenae]|uniref:DUF3014 domain-containing protein n=1 Tax=Psychromonas ossibalaenae TaxID=444922 RepID=UPI0003778A43|nr:DUF3014 domain-containing protein [Psychromonas ossibalaenae]